MITRGKEQEDIENRTKISRMKILETERLVTYLLIIGQDNRRPVIKREILRYKRGVNMVLLSTFSIFEKEWDMQSQTKKTFEQTDEEIKSEKNNSLNPKIF